MNPLNVLDCPLDGVNLIEASAGTGKTWTIAALYTRLLLEANAEGEVPGIDQVLVVTYTKAATAELRGRLRQRLRELCSVLEGRASDDPFLLAMARRHPPGGARVEALARLHAAIAGFDTAAIYTIHGFCQRALTDTAFESGQTFGAELVQDDSQRLQDSADDYWRRGVVHDALLARVLAEAGETPELWLSQVRPFLSKPYLHWTRPPEAQLPQARARLERAWRQLGAARADCVEALERLQEVSGLHGSHYSAKQKAQMRQTLTQFLDSPDEPPALSTEERKLLGKLTPQSLSRYTLKTASTPVHPAYELINDWLEAWDAYCGAIPLEVTRLKLDLIDWMGREMARRRREERKRSFDDLLSDLDQALSEPTRGPVLARQLSASFKVALIDEFQDTDPVQYHIFRTCFVEQHCPVFLVGDPKQAIYSFRGADIFAYLAARDDALLPRQYTLDTNRRSQAPLVSTVNALFSRPEPFLLPEIGYAPVLAQPSEQERLEIDDPCAPFNWQWLAFADSDKGATKQQAEARAAAACANEIARLLLLARAGRARLSSTSAERALCGGDIAVLVMTHWQGDQVRQALNAMNIPSVTLSQESVFASREARECLLLLRAWAEPGHEGRLRLALATELYGWRADQLQARQADESAWESLLAAHAQDHERWLQHGFMSAWRQFFARQALAERLLPLADGERRLTNLAHLAELLQKESETRHGIAPLLEWFDRQVTEEGAGEETMLRLESDASLVKITTVHSAKGLQYPIVFCPFLWDGALEKSTTAFWRTHREDGSWLTPDSMVDDEVKRAARGELLAEKLRLTYVALTRAQHRQYVAWGWVRNMETAALSWLLHAPHGVSLEQLEPPGAGQVHDELSDFVRRGGSDLALIDEQAASPLPLADHAATAFHAQRVTRAIYTPWRVASFTGLVQHGAREREAPDHDRGNLSAPDAASPLAFPRGARAGTCLHAILERIDFTAPSAQIHATVQQTVNLFGFDPESAGAACALVDHTLQAPLAPGVMLKQIPRGKRLVELEFMLPVERLKAERLGALLADPASGLDPALRQAALALDFGLVRGFLKGFIDLVFEAQGQFYLVDYKSNYLGDEPECYDHESMARSIGQEHYYLQYLLYCVAIRRYFKSRGVDFDQRFAGVRYLYMRGLGLDEYGIWCDQPSLSLLDEMDTLLTQG